MSFEEKQDMKYLLIISFTVVFLSTTSATSTYPDSTLSKISYMASINNSLHLWETAIDKYTEAYQETRSNEVLLQLTYAYYGLAGYCISEQNKDLGKKTIKEGIRHCKNLQKISEFESDANALLAAFYGLSIAFNPMKGMSLGPKSDRLIKKALKANSDHPFAWFQKGSSLYNTPRMFGGNVNKSIDAFKKSLELYEIECSANNWQRLQVLVWLGQAYHKTEQYEKATETYNSILSEAPDYGWVKQYLLPRTLKKSDS